MEGTFDSDKRKLLSSICHGSIFFSPLFLTIGIPFVVSLLSDDPVVKENAKEAINFHLNVWFYGAIAATCAFLWFLIIPLVIAWILGGLLLVANYVLPVLAILKCLSNPNESYRYPFIFRLL
jgi:uncharacterized protein